MKKGASSSSSSRGGKGGSRGRGGKKNVKPKKNTKGKNKRGNKTKNKKKSKEELEEERRLEEEAKKRAEARKIEKERKKALKEKRKEAKREEDVKADAKAFVKRVNEIRKRRFRIFQENDPETVETKRKVMMSSKGKSDLKKIESLLKKIKMSSDNQLNSIISGIQKLNLARFGTEIIGALQENTMKLKSSDVLVTVEVCACVNLKYPTLLPSLVEVLLEFVKDTNNEEKERRSVFRFLLELEFCGIIKNRASKILIKMIETQQEFAKSSKPLGKESMKILSFISGVCKYAGREITGGIMSSKEQKYREIENLNVDEFKQTGLSSERTSQIVSLLESTRKIMIDCLIDKIKALRTLEKTNEDSKFVHGTLNEARITKQEKLTLKCEKLESVMRVFFDTLNVKMPDLSEIEDEHEDTVEGGISLWDGKESSKNMGPLDGPYEDEVRRAFYEDIPDIKEMVPAVLLMSKDVRKAERLAEIQKREAERAVKDKESQSLNGDVNKRGTLDGALKQLSVRVSEKKHEDTTTSASDLVKSITTKTTTTKEEEEEKNTTKSYDQDDDDDDDGKTLHTSAKLENLLDSLPFCVNANLVLNFAVDFCYLNSKAARARLVEKIFRAPRVALELLPYYSLLVAILSKVYDGIVEPLESLLCGEFRGLQNKKDVSFNRRESKIRNARFIGELIKFRVFAPKIAFYVLRYCFQDFCHENVVIACTLLENCGRFLYRSKPTHAKCARQLEILMRLKENKVQDQNLEYLIDNAFYQCVPQTNQGIKKKERSPMYLYIRHLILNRLAPVQGGLMKNRHKKQRAVLRHVTKLIKKLDLRDQVTQNMLIKSFLSVTKGKFGSIKNVCGVLKALRFQKYDFITVRVIDSLLELIRSGLDVSDFRHNQRRVGQIKFLGEMLVSKLVSMNLIFETLYMLIEIGHPFPAPEKNDDGDNNGILPLRPLRLGEPRSLRSHPSVLCKADMPHDVFRIRLICVLLDTIHGVLKRGNVHAKRLDTFLLYFDRYVAFKWSLTLETKFMIENTIEDLRPGRDIPGPSLVNEAEEKVEIFEKSLNYDDTAYDDDAVEVTEQDDIEEENELEEKDEETDDDSETEEEQHQEEEEEEEEVEIKVQLIGREEHTTEVDVDFENALRSMMTSTTTAESVRSKLTNRNLDQLSIPVSLLGERSRTTSKATKNGVKFKLLNRRKGKILTKDIVIPERVSLSRYALLSRDTERQEREEFAKRILEGAERQELEGETGVAPLMKIQQPIIYQKNTQKNRKF